MRDEVSPTLTQLRAPRRERPGAKDDLSLYAPAGFVLRWYALTLDLVFIAPVELACYTAAHHRIGHLRAYGHSSQAAWLLAVVLLGPFFAYFVAATAASGQTLGKKIVGIRVTSARRREDLTLKDVLVRETVGKLLSFGLCGLGGLMMRRSPRLRALHDYLGHSRVIAYTDAPHD